LRKWEKEELKEEPIEESKEGSKDSPWGSLLVTFGTSAIICFVILGPEAWQRYKKGKAETEKVMTLTEKEKYDEDMEKEMKEYQENVDRELKERKPEIDKYIRDYNAECRAKRVKLETGEEKKKTEKEEEEEIQKVRDEYDAHKMREVQEAMPDTIKFMRESMLSRGRKEGRKKVMSSSRRRWERSGRG
jgi:hypothetical protein